MGDPTPTPTPDPAPPAPTPQPTPQPTPDPVDDGKGGKSAILADLAKERDARQALETRLAEMQTAQQQQMDALAKAFGVKSDDPPDPVKLAEQVTAEQARAREAAVQLAVYRTAAKHGGNPDALLDSASFLRAVADLDPNDSDAVGAAIKTAVAANARLAAITDVPPGAAGIGVLGSGGAPADPRLRDLAQIEADLAAQRR